MRPLPRVLLFLPAFFLLAMTLTACDSSKVDGDDVYSGEELFRAFMFLEEGRVTQELPELFGDQTRTFTETDLRAALTQEEIDAITAQGSTVKEVLQIANNLQLLDAAQLAEMQQVVADVLQDIEDNNGSFFDDFATDIQSGNELIITTALEGAVEEYKASIQRLYDIDIDAQLSRYETGLGAGKAITFVLGPVVFVAAAVVLAVGAAVWAAGGVHTWAWRYTWQWDDEKHDQGGGKAFHSEYGIGLIAQRLYVPSLENS